MGAAVGGLGWPEPMSTVCVRSRSNGVGDRRWIVLDEDGRFITLWPSNGPREEEIIRVENDLRAQGLAGCSPSCPVARIPLSHHFCLWFAR